MMTCKELEKPAEATAIEIKRFIEISGMEAGPQGYVIHPLEDFAVGWLSRWTHFGADAYMGKVTNVGEYPEDVDARLIVGFPTYGFSPVSEEDERLITDSDLPASLLADRRSFNANFYDGKVRELYSLLEAVPGGYGAVQAVVEAFPLLGYGRRAKASAAPQAA